MRQFTVSTTQQWQVIDITEEVENQLPLTPGVTSIAVLHTTAALTTADLDPGTDLDLLDFLQGIVPPVAWRHPHDPAHAPAHLLASVIGSNVTLPYEDSRLRLGTWQRLVLIELDGPRNRQLTCTFLPEPA